MGYRVIGVRCLYTTERVRRHRKKRIDKKWRKRYGYRQVPDKCVYVTNLPGMGCVVIGHPETLERVLGEIETVCNDPSVGLEADSSPCAGEPLVRAGKGG